MSNYIKSTDFSAKDALLTGNPLKIVSGTEIDDEFNAIQTAVNTKANSNSANLTGTPTAPTASAGVNTTQIATTAYVTSAVTTATGSLGSLSTQDSDSVSITGGTLTNITLTSPTFSGGAIDNTAIGTSTPAVGTFTTLTGTLINVGSWQLSLSGSDIVFSYSGTNKMKLTTGGNLIVVGDITAFGTV